MIRRWQHPSGHDVMAISALRCQGGGGHAQALPQRFTRWTALLLLLTLSACQWPNTSTTPATKPLVPTKQDSGATPPHEANPPTTHRHGIPSTAPFPAALVSSEIWLAAGTFHAHIEGPTMDAAGNFYAVNVEPSAAERTRHATSITNATTDPAPTALGRIGKVTPTGEVSTLLQLPTGSIGNGLQFDQQGALWIADYKAHKIWRWHQHQLTAVWTIPAMYQPNDVVVTKQGVIFATDPSWAKGTGQLWRLRESDGATRLQQMGTTNGIALSPDERWLYVNESQQRRVWRFAVMPDATLGPAELLFTFADHGLDGMETSSDGDLWISRHGKGTIVRLSADGQWRGEYCLHGQFPSNVVFSNDGQWLYITMQRSGSVERLAVQQAKPCA